MRISDWSSDVCSSDLDLRLAPVGDRHGEQILVAHKTDPPSVARDIEVDFRRFAGRQPPRLAVRRRRIKVAVERKGQEAAVGRPTITDQPPRSAAARPPPPPLFPPRKPAPRPPPP